MIDLASIQARDKTRAQHERLIAEFLAGGGEIQVLDHVERAPIKQTEWNYAVTPNEDNRKAYLELERKIAEHDKALAATGLTVERAVRQMRKRWGPQATITCAKAEQIAARYGYAYPCSARGRP